MSTYQVAIESTTQTNHITAVGDSAPMCDIDTELSDWSEIVIDAVALAASNLCPICAKSVSTDAAHAFIKGA
jgi:hypothetical protein